ncbi:MAG: F0F1 ATP synthase subunit epsilon [Candidatus Omnitrophica bacterium]|nr:F0F1 ATP synthase subunit epsilon [Candidatus Omnitrophota bacterium]
MAPAFNVSIVTPESIAYQGRAVSLIAPAEFGYMGVLANHAPLVAKLVRGTITLMEPSGDKKKFGCTGDGFLEVVKNNATLLLDTISL